MAKKIEEEMKPFKTVMAKAADIICDSDVSAYPVMVAAQSQINIGINIVDGRELGSAWFINASSLEELVTKNLVLTEKVEDFKLVYKQASPDLCILVYFEQEAHFVFLPRG